MGGNSTSGRGMSRTAHGHSKLEPSQWRTVGLMGAVVLGLHALGLFLLIALVIPHHYRIGSGVFALGTGIAAYTLGLRHAVDADHISAIDNATRKLMGEGKRPMSVGFFFSLGHSTVVFGLALALALGARALGGEVANRGSALHDVAGWIGTGISGIFLYAIAALNIVILLGIVRVFREMRSGTYDEQELEHHLASRGLLNRVFGRFARAVSKPWQMYPIGLLFGLGFDTASEVALLFLAAGAAGAGLPFYAIVCLPVLFAAGMSLLDTIDGSFMNFAYGWAFSKPVRKVFYNLTITGLSAAVALIVGTIEVGGLVAEKLDAHGPVLAWLENINLNTLGFVIVGLFAGTWAVAVGVWRFGRIEQRWEAHLIEPREPAGD